MILVWLTILIIVFVMLVLGVLVNKKTSLDREKSSPFECGFDPLNSSRTPFSIRFFVITLVFLIFDVEITLLLPVVFLNVSIMGTYLVVFFSFVLTIGLLYEWKEGALSWIK
uniref:NADH-ubiquinone oxidoreductase chain 3 n=1 Tax=Artemia tibetiana TaxID=351233 RepID=M9NVV9_9CRUS|nr:NADH dehydrogenase subunit 3 [Artemia tibetiana]YP_010735564.1 NADH dehydrogenase subunit 3 [Artemia sorgeloosi]AFP72836.1 NADH dehydrogenase subunit 3 [Artemia tibetiana]AFP72849.1 NADH dehydrogenase subunit 3 [Artemia tibetiana]UZP16826.1 NADH dehydrogenase subunit 3 [Artemia tibetiana]UZP16839.1 NADH dehydrogenase subunit 3 [Artemia tibetiana]UZP16852.1 NADH dehydrogenase subunit 3 [Artemia tibetiana]